MKKLRTLIVAKVTKKSNPSSIRNGDSNTEWEAELKRNPELKVIELGVKKKLSELR